MLNALKKYILIFLLCVLCSVANSSSSENMIKVWNQDFTSTHSITDSEVMIEIIQIWKTSKSDSKGTVKDLNKDEIYKIDIAIEEKGLSGRWLYSKTGYFKILSKTKQKVFVVKNYNRLNELLGI